MLSWCETEFCGFEFRANFLCLGWFFWNLFGFGICSCFCLFRFEVWCFRVFSAAC